ncbi:efflux RND transporter periplasmic adaptor subunit [Candidatus Daviesbacteria bacterium]|nr:efflux RND transporter periplasmic adaptor subunit [Candidatus Daviesbacteria bacterium]
MFKRILNFIKRLPRWLVILIIATILGLLYFQTRANQPQKLQLAQIKRENLEESVSASGTVAGKNIANLKFLKGGKLTFVNVKTGDRVLAGQTLAGLDTQELSIALQQAQNSLKDKQAAAEKIIDDIHLFQYGNGGFANVGSANETMTQRQLRTTAEVARDNAFDNVRAAQRDFQDTVITSPFSGVVTQAGVFPGQFVGPGDTVAQVIDDGQTFFDAEIDQADFGKIFVGQEADLTFDSFPDQTISGVINQILPQTKSSSTGANVVIARIVIHDPKNLIFGMDGQATIVVRAAKNVLAIPQEALKSDNTVLVQTPQGLKVVKVEPGFRSDTDVEIKSGLKEGDTVVLNPQ